MTFTEIKKNMMSRYKADFLTCAQIMEYVGETNRGRCKKKYLEGLDKIGKKYFLDDVARRIVEMKEI